MDKTLTTPSPPCQHCHGACCRKSAFDHKYAVELQPEEEARFPEARSYKIKGLNRHVKALPYIEDRCIHLSAHNQCQIYDRRPENCREFSCAASYCLNGTRHGFFLQDNPGVVQLIEIHLPEFAAERREERRKR
jgi:Fe-S-cluster containining protein